MTTVLFACVHNAGRSQIAAALFNKFVNPVKAQGMSAGSAPALQLHPEVVAAMKQRGFDLSTQSPKKLTAELASTANWLVTMGCGDECPVVPGTRRDDWPVQDPKGQPAEVVEEIVAEIERRVVKLIAENNWN